MIKSNSHFKNDVQNVLDNVHHDEKIILSPRDIDNSSNNFSAFSVGSLSFSQNSTVLSKLQESREQSSLKKFPDASAKGNRTFCNVFKDATSRSSSPRWTQKDLSAALQLVRSGTPIKPAAEKCNMPVMTLWRRTRALGLVSSKVQCGFRYPTRGSVKSTKSAHSQSVESDSISAKTTQVSKTEIKRKIHSNEFSSMDTDDLEVTKCCGPSRLTPAMFMSPSRIITDCIDPVCTPPMFFSNTTNNIPIFSTQIQFLQQLQSHDTVVNSVNRNPFMKFIDYSNPVLVGNESQQPINLTTNSDLSTAENKHQEIVTMHNHTNKPLPTENENEFILTTMKKRLNLRNDKEVQNVDDLIGEDKSLENCAHFQQEGNQSLAENTIINHNNEHQFNMPSFKNEFMNGNRNNCTSNSLMRFPSLACFKRETNSDAIIHEKVDSVRLKHLVIESNLGK